MWEEVLRTLVAVIVLSARVLSFHKYLHIFLWHQTGNMHKYLFVLCSFFIHMYFAIGKSSIALLAQMLGLCSETIAVCKEIHS